MTEDQFPQSADQSLQGDHQPLLNSQVISDENGSDDHLNNLSSCNPSEATSEAIADHFEEKKNTDHEIPALNKFPRLGSLNLSQIDQQLNQDQDQEVVAQNTDWFTLARKLRQHNRELVKTVVQLEQALANTQESLQSQMIQFKNSELVINQQTEELNNTQKQVSRLFYELEASHKTAQCQQNVLDNLTEQLEKSQEQTAQLERECALLQEAYNEQSHQLILAEKQVKELRDNLHQIKRQNWQQSALVSPSKSNSDQAKIPIESSISSEVLEIIKNTQLAPEIDDKFDKNLSQTSETERLINQENQTDYTPTYHHQPIKPWSSQKQDLPLPPHFKLDLQNPFEWEINQNLEANNSLDEVKENLPSNRDIEIVKLEIKEASNTIVLNVPTSANNKENQTLEEPLIAPIVESKLVEELKPNSDDSNSYIENNINKSKKSKSHLLLPLESSKELLTRPIFINKIREDQLNSETVINDFENEENQTQNHNFSSSDQHQKKSPSPLIYPRISPKTKKSPRSINLPNFSQYNSIYS